MTTNIGNEDVWDACTNPRRLRRWYAPVEGDLRVGGTFSQGDFGSGRIVRCESPRLLTVALGGGDPTALHLRDDLRPAIEQGMAALAELIEADKRR